MGPEVETTEYEPLSDRLLRLVRNASIVGLGVTLLFHLLVGVVLNLFEIVRQSDPPMIEPRSNVVEYAVLPESDLQELVNASIALDAPVVPEIQAEQDVQVEMFESISADDMAASAGDFVTIGTNLGGGDITDGAGLGTGGAGSGGGARFFGVEASGTRFAFVVDVSGSMRQGGKLQALQQELVRAVEGLVGNAEFLIVAYSSGAFVLGGESDWREATDRAKRWARRQVSGMDSGGGTNPVAGFEVVYRLRKRPDAIYFMTDGEFPVDDAFRIVGMNADSKIPIHCITFVNDDAAPQMKQIATSSGGTYTHVAGP